MKPNIHIRQATVEDSQAIARVQVDSYRTAYAGLLPQAYLDRFTYEEEAQDWRSLIANPKDDLLYVAETETDEIIGYALGRVGPSAIAPYDSELVALHVRQYHQRQGVGGQLLKTMAAQLQQQGCSSLIVWVLAENSAPAFYERLGGWLIGQQQVQLDDDVTAIEVAYGWPDISSLAS